MANLEALAEEFVEKYIELGDVPAALWLYPQIDKSQYDEMKSLVEKGFIDRGYSFD